MKKIKRERAFLFSLKVIGDILIVFFSYQLSYLIRHGVFFFYGREHFLEYIELFGFVVVITFFSFLISKVYKHRRSFFSLDELKYVFNALFIAFLITVFFVFFSKGYQYSRAVIFLWFTFDFIFISFFHFVFSRFETHLHSKGFGVKNIAIIGKTDTGVDIQRKLKKYPAHGMKFIGFITKKKDNKKNVLGRLENLTDIIKKYNIGEIIIADDTINDNEKMKIIKIAIKYQIHVIIASSIFELLSSDISVTEIYGIPTLTVSPSPIRGLNLVLKRLIDISISFFVLLISLPFSLFISIAIKLDSRGPVFFKQLRVTKKGRIFNCLKFRSMVKNAEKIKDSISHLNEQIKGPIFKAKNDPRITRVGKFLRKYSIDEFPQFINVFLGQMSIVGPRPPIPEEVEEYNSIHIERLKVKQGITGLWQVSGRSELSFEDMVKLDIFYIEHWSLWIDIKIILKTIPAIITTKGAY